MPSFDQIMTGRRYSLQRRGFSLDSFGLNPLITQWTRRRNVRAGQTAGRCPRARASLFGERVYPDCHYNRDMGFGGLRVLALGRRCAAEMEQLIRKQDGDPFVAPSMREAPLAENSAAFAFAERLFAGEFAMVVLLTGVGTRQLNPACVRRVPEPAFADALRRVTLVARGPKPVAALREM